MTPGDKGSGPTPQTRHVVTTNVKLEQVGVDTLFIVSRGRDTVHGPTLDLSLPSTPRSRC